MPSLNSYTPAHCSGPVSRRNFLQIGALGLGGLGLANFLRLRAEAGIAPGSEPNTSVIMLWLHGGLPHMETYDMKPDAPSEYRGEFRPIRTNVPGIEICELLPQHAKIADRFSLIRSFSHTFGDHGGGHKRFMTGRIPKAPEGMVNDAPAAGSIIAKERERIHRGVPHFICAPDSDRVGADTYSLGAAYLGPSYTPFEIPGDPSDPNFKVQNLSLSNDMATRLGDRRSLLGGLDRLRRNIDKSGTMMAMDTFNQKAFDLLMSPQARNAFDLTRESSETRARYGRHPWGQRTLLARRLVEAGSSFVTAAFEVPLPKPWPVETHYNWDCHALNCHMFKDTRWRLSYLDQSVSALIEDIYHRGLDKKIMVIVAGEFGHTPKLSYKVNTRSGVLVPGRDHWPAGFSVLVSGGDMRMGQVIGSTNAKGEVPKDRPLTPNDLWATVYRHLGIDYTKSYLDHSGRPMPILPFGEPIHELL